jgi:hypothetical protein
MVRATSFLLKQDIISGNGHLKVVLLMPLATTPPTYLYLAFLPEKGRDAADCSSQGVSKRSAVGIFSALTW